MLSKKNKVCIVGNSCDVLEKNIGEFIDSHEVVVRLNQPIIGGFEKHVGQKITHMYICEAFFPNHGCKMRELSDAKWFSRDNLIIQSDAIKRTLFQNGTMLFPKYLKEENIKIAENDIKDIALSNNIKNVNIEKIQFEKTSLNDIYNGYGKNKFGSVFSPLSGTGLINHFLKTNDSVSIYGYTLDYEDKPYRKYWGWPPESSNPDWHKIKEDVKYIKGLIESGRVLVL